MPKDSIISEGRTTNEAIEKGLKELKVSKNMVNIKVLENEEKRSFFSILAPRVVKVELTLKEGAERQEHYHETHHIKREKKPLSEEALKLAKKNIENFLDEFLKQIGNDITYKINTDEFGLEIVIEGKDASCLIGYRGETLYSFQSIISAVANKGETEKVRILLDVENYKEKREKALEDLAVKISKTVERTRKSITLEPMQAYERKIIHTALQSSNTVKTESIGEEPRRRVVVSLK